VAVLRDLAPRFMAFGHCTGAHAVHRLWNEFPAECHELHVGRRFELGD
jgi:metal-dependent hydrolase (beta-lactamase superfamily II)